jgi:hypothetical protein
LEPENEYTIYIEDLIAADVAEALNKIQRKVKDILPDGTEYTIDSFVTRTSTYNHLTVDATILYWSKTIGGIKRV